MQGPGRPVRHRAGQEHRRGRGARDLDLGESLLRSWKTALAASGAPAFPGSGNPPALEEELRRLRAENKRLTMERDFLKKATAFLAGESS
uniref:transposase n=1 Tax=Paludisphaera soli TaxID=2712865 RepID=UPI0036F34EF7